MNPPNLTIDETPPLAPLYEWGVKKWPGIALSGEGEGETQKDGGKAREKSRERGTLDGRPAIAHKCQIEQTTRTAAILDPALPRQK